MSAGTAAACVILVAVVNFLVFLFCWPKAFFCCCSTLGSSNGRRAAAGEAKRTLFAHEVISPAHLVQGVLGPVFTCVLRASFIALFIFAVVWEQEGPPDYASGPKDGKAEWLTYFTNWTWMLYCTVALLGVVVYIMARRRQWALLLPYSPSSIPAEAAERSHRTALSPLEVVFLHSYVTVLSCGLALTVFYWATLFEGGPVYVDNVMRHGAGYGLMLLDLMLSRFPVYTPQVMSVIWYPTAYVVFMLIYHAASGEWVYSSLDYNKTSSPAFYMGLIALFLLGFGVVFGLAALRETVFRRWGCAPPRDSKQPQFIAQGTEGQQAGRQPAGSLPKPVDMERGSS